MIIPYQYTYLVTVLFGLILWLILFIHRKDLRREMILMSVLIAIFGLYAEYFWWTRDWWNPPTITGTRIGPEDIINGFATGGIVAVLYEEVFKKRVYKYKSSHNFMTLIIVAFLFITSSILFHNFSIQSWIASSIALLISGSLLIIRRKDLFMDALLTGVSLVLGLIPFYLVINFISPGYI